MLVHIHTEFKKKYFNDFFEFFFSVTSKDLSETDTDSDVLYETKSKVTSFGTRSMNGELAHGNGWKNGHSKTRKIKT